MSARISVIKSDAGDMRVALRMHDGEAWCERLHPRLHTVHAHAPANRRLDSSPLELVVSAHIARDVADEPASIEHTEGSATEPGVAEAVADERPLDRIITHGRAADRF